MDIREIKYLAQILVISSKTKTLIRCSSCQAILSFNHPRLSTTGHPFWFILQAFVKLNSARKQCVVPVNHSYSCVCSCTAWLCYSASAGGSLFLHPLNLAWPCHCLTLRKMWQRWHDTISESRPQEALQLLPPNSGCLRLLYEEAWVIRSHLIGGKSWGRELEYHKPAASVNCQKAYMKPKDQPVPRWCANWPQMHEWAQSAPRSAETRHHRWALAPVADPQNHDQIKRSSLECPHFGVICKIANR